VECATLHGLSRALYEEVQFDTEKVTSRDWISHPTLRHADVPERIDVVVVNGDPNPHRPDLPPYGAGEAALKPMLAAIANAIYDATGVRIRRVPFRDDRVLAALKAATPNDPRQLWSGCRLLKEPLHHCRGSLPFYRASWHVPQPAAARILTWHV
jgi:hypothetical protein